VNWRTSFKCIVQHLKQGSEQTSLPVSTAWIRFSSPASPSQLLLVQPLNLSSGAQAESGKVLRHQHQLVEVLRVGWRARLHGAFLSILDATSSLSTERKSTSTSGFTQLLLVFTFSRSRLTLLGPRSKNSSAVQPLH
jgi:hypothetical protein